MMPRRAHVVVPAVASILLCCGNGAQSVSGAGGEKGDATDLGFRPASTLSQTITKPLLITNFAPGTIPDGGADWHPAIQSAIDSACSYGYTTPPVVIPQGTFGISQPILSTCANETIGASRTGSVLQPVFNGPAIVMEGKGSSLLPLVPARIGTGSALAESAAFAQQEWLDFREVPGVDRSGQLVLGRVFGERAGGDPRDGPLNAGATHVALGVQTTPNTT